MSTKSESRGFFLCSFCFFFFFSFLRCVCVCLLDRDKIATVLSNDSAPPFHQQSRTHLNSLGTNHYSGLGLSPMKAWANMAECNMWVLKSLIRRGLFLDDFKWKSKQIALET
eukprot:TRINITY_DN26541_c0_g1_i1.p1 TRINITY_DN26541_c0_g1~~TRINITY_DN26541_c0_g1_i1.p1  ORF type:complete len:112 (+),score=7.41 TRINITY_DN26541_c0_g1_i1:38-373(+)